MSKTKIEYSTNNSGGSFWLRDRDWFQLEDEGWAVDWNCADGDQLLSSMFKPDPDFPGKARFLGSLAGGASKEGFAAFADGIREFERITGQDASDEGCNCCGPPHSFVWVEDTEVDRPSREYASGEDVCAVLFGADAPTSLRAALEREAK